MKALRAGVIGVGRIGSQHARVLAGLDGVQLVGVFDIDPEQGESVGDRLGVRHFSTGPELCAAADAVVVAVPTSSHFEVAAEALAADCHVMVEKPIARTIEEADRLVEVAGTRGLLLCVGHIERYNGVIRMCAPYLDDPRFIESLRLAPFQPRGTDVTVILDLMIHDIDLVLGLIRHPVVEVHAVGVSVLSGSTDIANARLEFANGAVADITASRVSEIPIRRLRAFQNSGFLSLDLAERRGRFQHARSEFDPALAGRDPIHPLAGVVESIPLECDGTEPLLLELQAFVRAIGGDASAAVSGREGRAALEVAERITRAVESTNDVAAEVA